MADLVADTSSLVSLGAAENAHPAPLPLLVERYDVHVPSAVVRELEETASYEDPQGEAAGAALSLRDQFETRDAEPDPSFPLDEGENAAVSLANELGADLFLCDEFNALPLIHASLTDTRLLTTPTLLRVMHKQGLLTGDEAVATLDEIGDVRSWGGNSYVSRVRQTLRREG